MSRKRFDPRAALSARSEPEARSAWGLEQSRTNKSLTLYGKSLWTSPYVLACFVALREKELPFEVKTVVLNRGGQHEARDRLDRDVLCGAHKPYLFGCLSSTLPSNCTALPTMGGALEACCSQFAPP